MKTFLGILVIPFMVLSAEFEQICDSPRIFVCPNFLSDAECDHFIKIAKDSLTRTSVADPNSADGRIDSRRTSLGTWISGRNEDRIVANLIRRISEATRIREENGESFQILYYRIGAEYQPHFDYFDPSTPGGLLHYKRGGQRIATFMVYLNTTEQGGETIFPRAKIKIAPEKGKAVLFYNVNPYGKEDPMSLHGGAPVIQGEKWLLTRWLREREFH